MNFYPYYIAILLSPVSALSQGVWTQKASLPGVARADAMSFSVGMKGYVIAGEDVSLLQDFWIYDATNNSWLQKPDFPGSAREQGVSFSIGSKGYVGMGGQTKNDLWEYDVILDSWTQKANLPADGRNAAVGFSIGNYGYVGAGLGGIPATYHNDFWQYDPSSNVWAPKANIPGARAYGFGLSIGTKGYIGTGYDSTGGSIRDDFWEYNPATDNWTQRANFPNGKRLDIDGGYFVIGSYGYVGTGCYPASGPKTNDFWKYNPANDTWTPIASLSTFGRMGTSNFSINNKGYIGFGFDNSGSKINDLWEYDTTSVGISEIKDDLEISVFPNPSIGSFTINTTSKVTGTEIFNVMGEEIKVGKWLPIAIGMAVGNNSQTAVDISKEPEGVYFVRVRTEMGIVNKKIVVVK